jgi:large subunit ribosomal protein L13
MFTRSAKASEIQRSWYIIDAEGQPLGRLAAEVAMILRGKWKPLYTPHVDCGDHVVVVNASRVRLTGRKGEQKYYFRHSGYPGNAKYRTVRQTKPEEVVRAAIKGMLPKTRLGRAMIGKLKIYEGPYDNQHAAQKPIAHTIGTHGRVLEGRNAS